MNTGFTLFFYGLSAILLSLSFRKDREKTNRAVKKAVFMMLGVLPYFLTILLVTGTAFFYPAVQVGSNPYGDRVGNKGNAPGRSHRSGSSCTGSGCISGGFGAS